MKLIFCWLLSFTLSSGVAVQAYPANRQLTLPELNAEADLVVKVTAISNDPVTDEKPEPETSWGYRVADTRFRVVSVLKGETKGATEITYRHLTRPLFGGSVEQWFSIFGFDFTPGRSYLLWANDSGAGWRQFETSQNNSFAVSALLAPDDAPVSGAITDVVWNQTVGLLQSAEQEDVRTGISNLTKLNRQNRKALAAETGAYSNAALVAAVAPFIESSDRWTALGAMRAAAMAPATVMPQLMRVSRGENGEFRLNAVYALSAAKTPASWARVREMTQDDSPDVRAMALDLLKSLPNDETRAIWRRAAHDPDIQVRKRITYIVTSTQDEAMLPTLGEMLRDSSPEIAKSAAEELLRILPDKARSWWEKERAHPLYGDDFILKLAENAPDISSYLPDLTRIVADTSGANDKRLLRIGRDTRGWELLFAYLQKQPAITPENSGRTQAIFGALETPDQLTTYNLQRLKKFYGDNGLTQRAQNLPAQASAAL